MSAEPEQITLTEPITLVLKPASVTLILTALNAGPYRDVAPVIEEVQGQLRQLYHSKASTRVEPPAPTSVQDAVVTELKKGRKR